MNFMDQTAGAKFQIAGIVKNTIYYACTNNAVLYFKQE